MPRSERILSTRALNRALLARQLLLERVKLPLGQAVERLAGLQTQYAPSGYIALWSRLVDFQRAALTRALEQRRIVQATLMRATIHMVTARDFRWFTAAIWRGRQEWWTRWQRKHMQGIDMEAVAARVRELLSAGPRRAKEIQTLLAGQGFPPIAAVSAKMWVDMVRVPPAGTWEMRRADLYGLADRWLPPVEVQEVQEVQEVEESEALEHLVRRYLGAFGPASLNDLASWAGLAPAFVAPVIARLDLRRFADERGTELLDLPRAPLPDPDTPAPVRFLGTWEPVLLVQARRTQILPERYRPRVFSTKMPQSVPTFLVDGAVAGAWRYEKGRIRLTPFGPIPRVQRKALDQEAERLAGFHGDEAR